MIKKTLQSTYAIWFAIVFAFTFIPLYPVFLILLSHKSGYYLANKLRKLWALLIMLFSGLWISIKKENQNMKSSLPCIYVSNHSSYLDILCMSIIARGNYMFLAKKELKKIPLFRVFFRTVDVAVDRKNNVEAAKSYKQTEERIKEGYSFIIYPEGTIGNQAPRLASFKNGAFKLAIENELPIVPVTMLDNYKRLVHKNGISGSPGQMRTVIHNPIETKGLTKEDIPALKSKVYTIIENTLIEYKIIEKND
ncbi:MAG: 1-acyl-sn-glycerol-3-phosphate acyltransferase [Bacteroidia bacterium]|nr:1-acyl-sn-glycerol-3-phosphate acyltransferase [Bacteroidia bacterium]MCO5254108.1 1-acyl-sn-glycerol-3-phosphate acyltransferase [Bacteroidota bacterium]MCZ2129970.1 1-acyl-sn-glycerol-3-phosphate acyltransferase [Bacteroidia bacterium]